VDQETDSLLILCVEDNDDDWVELQTQLASAKIYAEFGIAWKRCKSIHQAKSEIESQRPDIILLDLKLVDSANPLDTTRTVSEIATPLGIPIVILSGLRDDPTIARECSLAGAFQHLQKGRFDEINLLNAIRLSYQRNRELQRQRDLYLNAQLLAAENLALAEQAAGVLTKLRADLRRFARNERNRRVVYTALLASLLFVAFPSIEANTLKLKVSSEVIGLFTILCSFIWGQGTFHERLRQAESSHEVIMQLKKRHQDSED
jgi:CheY-like chemotaxis protein